MPTVHVLCTDSPVMRARVAGRTTFIVADEDASVCNRRVLEMTLRVEIFPEDLDAKEAMIICLLKTTIERLNKEIKRRTERRRVFPNPPALLRLAGAVPAEIQDEWQVSDRRILSEASMPSSPDASPASNRPARRLPSPPPSVHSGLGNPPP